MGDSKFNVSFNNFTLAILCVISIILASNRLWLTTTDTSVYLESFENFTDFSLGANAFEPAFSFITYIVKAFGGGGYVFFLIIASLGVGLKFTAIKKYSPYMFLSLLAYYAKYFLLQDMIQIRAGVAAGIFLLSLKHIKERNLKLFLLYIFIASLFHYSAFIYILLYFVCDERLSINKFLIVAIISIIFFKLLNLELKAIQLNSGFILKMETYSDLKDRGLEMEISIFST